MRTARNDFLNTNKNKTTMAKTLEQIKASRLAMDIQEFTAGYPECNGMTVEDFVYHLLDFSRKENNDQ